ncbi:MAG TPA: deoxyribose-phosphate aldolase [Dictyoglomaceae bacterium]|nr:deoxyribose-phosphate aldolase [Dictyoglomaceae bacterium]HOL38919.1 deoxyribose-phosphate aldolase [Dictyoglomaceae bacterium]HOP94893.1 deoxyribose-phosphate aldolase [Dictyoglomaceae bacterium]HPP15664.1 deoxyribose-phosphate aldolase [Dictyoglomaceae bacterium]HPU43380.1 deoxyribose-phosphate aldolase [Dictyoglomaceae bacterium]
MDKKTLAKMIDHTLLKPIATTKDIEKLCLEAIEYGFYSVCINSCYIPLAKNFLEGTDIKICTVIDFPLGASATSIKVFQVSKTLELGANEFDMVINIGALKDRRRDYLANEIREIVKAAENHIVKVIIETCYLTDDEKVYATEIIKESGAHFVKTSTGFGTGGATVEDILLLKRVAGEDLKIKASGGIRDFEQALNMIKAGADRIGASNSVSIVNGIRE